MSYQQEIQTFISEKTGIYNIDYDTLIFENGLVSSLFLFELITFIQKQYNIQINLYNLTLENFSSINAISSYIEKAKDELNGNDK